MGYHQRLHWQRPYQDEPPSLLQQSPWSYPEVCLNPRILRALRRGYEGWVFPQAPCLCSCLQHLVLVFYGNWFNETLQPPPRGDLRIRLRFFQVHCWTSFASPSYHCLYGWGKFWVQSMEQFLVKEQIYWEMRVSDLAWETLYLVGEWWGVWVRET